MSSLTLPSLETGSDIGQWIDSGPIPPGFTRPILSLSPPHPTDRAEAYPSIELKAAALFSSLALAQNHALFDGNKRLSLYLTFAFLRINGVRVTFTDDEAFGLVLAVAQNRLDLDEIAAALGEHSEHR